MASFDWKKIIEDSIKDGLIIRATTTGIFYVLKTANVKPSKASLDAVDIIKLTGGIMGGVLVKDYAIYKKWIKEQYNKHFMALLRAIKLHDTIEENVRFVLLVLRSKPTCSDCIGWVKSPDQPVVVV